MIGTTDRLIFVNIKDSYEAMINHDMTNFYYRDTLKECTRKFWNISDAKAHAATHILGCYKGIVKEVIKISSYIIDNDCYPGRKIFEGEEINNSKYIGMDIRDIFDSLANFRVKYYNL
ncbi:MAG: hypothetical protein NC388_03865 [Clostridium sp.]|nr:hypothetical protein [Clostridium sp.]